MRRLSSHRFLDGSIAAGRAKVGLREPKVPSTHQTRSEAESVSHSHEFRQ